MMMPTNDQKLLLLQVILIAILILPFFKIFLTIPVTIAIEMILLGIGAFLIMKLKKDDFPTQTVQIYFLIMIILVAIGIAQLVLPNEFIFPITLAIIVALSAFIGFRNIFQFSTIEGIVEESSPTESKIKVKANYLNFLKPTLITIPQGNLSIGKKVKLKPKRSIFRSQYEMIDYVN